MNKKCLVLGVAFAVFTGWRVQAGTFRIDASKAPQKAEWAEKELKPALEAYVSKVVELLDGKAAFLDYVVRRYGRDLVVKLNKACREGRYGEHVWKKLTGKSRRELAEEWKQFLQTKVKVNP